MVVDKLATGAVRYARVFGRLLGRELVVETSDHSIELSMEKPGSTNRAWDDDLYKRGNIFYAGYANPLKLTVDHEPEMGEKDTAEVEEGEGYGDGNADVISSPRYTQFMRNDLISQLLNPQEQWDKLLYGMIAIGALQFLTIVATLWATGSF